MKASKYVSPHLSSSYVSPHFDGEMITGDSLDPEFYNASGCGIRPICAFTKACKDKQAAWQACVASNSATKMEGKYGTAPSSAPTTAPSYSQSAPQSGMSMGAKIGIVLGVVAVIGGIAWYALK